MLTVIEMSLPHASNEQDSSAALAVDASGEIIILPPSLCKSKYLQYHQTD